MTPEFSPLKSSAEENASLTEQERQSFMYIETAPTDLNHVAVKGLMARLRQLFKEAL